MPWDSGSNTLESVRRCAISRYRSLPVRAYSSANDSHSPPNSLTSMRANNASSIVAVKRHHQFARSTTHDLAMEAVGGSIDESPDHASSSPAKVLCTL